MADQHDRAPEARLKRLSDTFNAYDRTGACADDWRGLAEQTMDELERVNEVLLTLMTVLVRRA